MKAIPNMHNFTGDLSAAAGEALNARLTKPRHYVDREVIFRAGDPPDYLFQVISGEIALCNYSVDGQEIILAKFLPGDCFGDTGIMDDGARINTAIAVGETELQSLSKAHFHELCDLHPEIMRQFSRMQANHVRLLLNLLVDASLLKLPARIARTLQRLLVSRGKHDESGELYIETSHEELARFVSASRQSTSLELKKLEQAGTISSGYGKITITDNEALDRFCEEISTFEPIAALYSDD
jgi:CRP-like cAMP-binding protein